MLRTKATRCGGEAWSMSGPTIPDTDLAADLECVFHWRRRSECSFQTTKRSGEELFRPSNSHSPSPSTEEATKGSAYMKRLAGVLGAAVLAAGLAVAAHAEDKLRIVVITHGQAASAFWSVAKNGVVQA